MSKRQKRRALRKNSIAFYHRFYVPETLDGKTFYTIRIVAEGKRKGITVNPKKVDLYEVIIENERARKLHWSLFPKGPNLNTSKNATSSSLVVNIRDLLRNVKDSKLNYYVERPSKNGASFNEQLPEWEKKNIKFSQYIKRISSSDFSRVQFPGRGRAGADRYIIKTEINLVNAREEQNNKVYQQARGAITFPSYDGAPVRITLGKNADKVERSSKNGASFN